MRTYVEDTLELAYNTITEPKAALAAVAAEQRLYEGVLIWAISVLLSVVSLFAQWERAGVWTVIALYGGAGLWLLLQVLLLHGTARLLGGNGPVKGLAGALCFANIPAAIGTLAGSFVFLVPEQMIQAVSCAAFVWSFVLNVFAIQVNYGLSAVRSVAALILPVLFLLGLLVVLALYIAVSLASVFE